MSTVVTKSAKAPNASARDYGYANARLRGMKSRLLKTEQLQRLLQADDIMALIQELMQTEYAPDLEEALLHGRSAAEVGEALRINLVRTYRKVFDFVNEEARDVVTTLLGRWDVFNIKSILRGKHVSLSSAEIGEGLLPVGGLSQTDLEGLLALHDIKAIVDTATTWELPQAPAMRQGFSDYQRTGELADFELALDRYYSDWASNRLARNNRNYALARRILGMQVDVANLVMVLRVAREDITPEQSEEYFLRGGNDVDLDLYQSLIGVSDVDDVLDMLRHTHFGKILDDAAVHYLETTSIATFERALEDYLTRKIIAVGGTDPLGVGIAIAYLWSKQNEVTNLRIIAKGTDIGIPPERVERELILV